VAARYKHLGIYAYRGIPVKFVQMPQSELEKAEKLEAVGGHWRTVFAIKVAGYAPRFGSVDTPEDVQRVKEILKLLLGSVTLACRRSLCRPILLTHDRLLFGDNLKWLRDNNVFPDASVDLVYLDPAVQSKRHYKSCSRKQAARLAKLSSMPSPTRGNGRRTVATYAEFVDNCSNASVVELVEALKKFLKTSPMMAYLAMMAPRLVDSTPSCSTPFTKSRKERRDPGCPNGRTARLRSEGAVRREMDAAVVLQGKATLSGIGLPGGEKFASNFTNTSPRSPSTRGFSTGARRIRSPSREIRVTGNPISFFLVPNPPHKKDDKAYQQNQAKPAAADDGTTK